MTTTTTAASPADRPEPPTPGAALAAPCTTCGTTGGYINPRGSRPVRARGLCSACYEAASWRGTLPKVWASSGRGHEIQRCKCGATANVEAVWFQGHCPDCRGSAGIVAPLLRPYPTAPALTVAPPVPVVRWARTAVWVRRPEHDPVARALHDRETADRAAA